MWVCCAELCGAVPSFALRHFPYIVHNIVSQVRAPLRCASCVNAARSTCTRLHGQTVRALLALRVPLGSPHCIYLN